MAQPVHAAQPRPLALTVVEVALRDVAFVRRDQGTRSRPPFVQAPPRAIWPPWSAMPGRNQYVMATSRTQAALPVSDVCNKNKFSLQNCRIEQ
jgi:hypothetical protein